jgi:drug/metabolite transporter (DMT)-like permease
MYLAIEDFWRLTHPTIAVLWVFPLLGIVVRMAWQTRQRRQAIAHGANSTVPATAGREHVQIGRWLATSVIGLELLGISQPMLKHVLKQNLLQTQPLRLVLIFLFYVVTIASLVLLYKAQARLWRWLFAGLTGLGVILLSFQDLWLLQAANDVIYRRKEELLFSHFYIGVTVTLLMIFAVAIQQEIYRDRTHRWRTVHIVANCLALVLFVAQGWTGIRDLLEIPLSWQEPAVYSCDFTNKICPTQPK